MLMDAVHETGKLNLTVGSDTLGTPASTDTVTFTNFWPEFPYTPKGVIIVASSALDTNASPGTLTVGDGTDADGHVVATSMGNLVFASGTGALMGSVQTNRDLVITLGTIGTAGSNVILTAFGLYDGGDSNA